MEQFKIFGFEMARISEVYLSTLSEIMKPYGMERYFVALSFINQNSGTATQKDLSVAIKVDKVTAKRMVDYLCQRNLVIRQSDSRDGRSRILSITQQGSDMIPKIRESVRKTNEILLSGFSDAEKEAFAQGLEKLYSKICSMPEPEFIVKAVKRKVK